MSDQLIMKKQKSLFSPEPLLVSTQNFPDIDLKQNP